jgi:hypothetical protein
MSNDVQTVYRDLMVRCVLGERPAMLAQEADTVLLERLAQRLAEAEVGMELMRAKGYGTRGVGLLDMIKALPQAGTIWSPTGQRPGERCSPPTVKP